MGAAGVWWSPQSSKLMRPDAVGLGGFDSHTLPPLRDHRRLPAGVLANFYSERGGPSMKKFLLLVVAVVAVWLGINYARTGRLALFPSAASPGEQRIHDLEQELARIESQIQSAGRAAGMTGMDTTGDVASLTAQKAQIEKQLAEARTSGR